MKATCFIHCRVPHQTKERLRALAQREQISESALLKSLLEALLRTSVDSGDSTGSASSPSTRDARLTVRLRADDRRLLRERAAARCMPDATYVSRLVRAHLQAHTPLPTQELQCLKRVLTELRTIGRSLNESTRQGAVGSRVPASREEVRAVLRACEAFRDHVRKLMDVNAASWEVPRA
jgi:hypothetical protein